MRIIDPVPGVPAPVGRELHAKGWIQEAALRMLMNNLDKEVAENPDQLVVYGGAGKAARNLQCYHVLIRELQELESDETLLVQSGKPVGIIKTHEDAPRVLIANSNLVGKWANWETFRKLEQLGLIMYGQMTAGSWIYIGTQGILQGTYETFSQALSAHFHNDLSGKWILSAGLGGMGGAQPLAASMAEISGIFIEVDPSHIRRRLETGYLDESYDSLDRALNRLEECISKRMIRSIGVVGNAGELFPEIFKRGLVPSLVTDQTSAHDTRNGYVPAGMSLESALLLRKENPDEYERRARETIAVHVQAMLDFMKAGSHVFDYGNNIRNVAYQQGVKDAFAFPGFVPAYIRPLFCEGKGPFRWVALSGKPADIHAIDEAITKLFPNNDGLNRWIRMASEKVIFQGLPARICWLGYGEREQAGQLLNEMVADGRVEAPIVIGRDHLDSGSVASPNRETEGMLDGSDAIADWPLLNAFANTACGASWVSFHHGGGVGIGYSLHAGMVIVADGTERCSERLQRVLTCDPALGILRHADAGYEKAIAVAKENRIKLPMLEFKKQ